jgi:hypothetical protein
MAIAQLAAQADPNSPPWQTCMVCHALATIPKSEADALVALLKNPAVRYSEISELIANDPDTPLDIPGPRLGKHATGKCGAKVKLR